MIGKFILEYILDDFILLMMIVGLWVVLVPNSPAIKRDRDFLRHLSIVVILMSIFTHLEIALGELPYPTKAHVVVSWICYSFKPCVVLSPLSLTIKNRMKYRMMWLLPVLNSLIYSTALYSPIAFSYNEQNIFIRGPLGFSVHIISAICMGIFIYNSWGTFGDRREKSHYILIFIGGAGMLAVLVETFGVRYCVNETVILCCYAYYVYLHIHYANKALEKQKERLRNQRDALMISQIQPHFMYNTLNIIYYLCRTNPTLAGETVVKFSDYLRNNLDMSTKPDQLIPFSQELQHTKTYADIEMLRFENVTVEYNIECDNFLVPALSVQPMVENAIRHGVRGKAKGVVLVTAQKRSKDYVVQIKDNGIGYIKQSKQMDKHEHIGIGNVKERIEMMCGGTFDISMIKGVGTTVTLTIPEMKE